MFENSHPPRSARTSEVVAADLALSEGKFIDPEDAQVLRLAVDAERAIDAVLRPGMPS